jgi:hypothetical protein
MSIRLSLNRSHQWWLNLLSYFLHARKQQRKGVPGRWELSHAQWQLTGSASPAAWEYHVENYFGMVSLGCVQILLRHWKDYS